MCVPIDLRRPSLYNCLRRCEGTCRPGYRCTGLFSDRVCLPGVEPLVDASSDLPPPPTVDTCTLAVVDLTAAGERVNAVTRYRGDTATAPERGNVSPPCGTGGDRRQVALRYTPRGRRRLRVSIELASLDAEFEPTLWAQDVCAPAMEGRSHSLGCVAWPDLSWVSREAVAAGTPVYFFVGGSAMAPRDRGRFELRIEEADDLATGAPCDPAADLCALGASCRGEPGAHRCVADGALGGACRDADCDPGLVCLSGSCTTSLSTGSRCGAGVTGSCARGTTCIGPEGAERCTREGAAGGACRVAPADAPCDPGLSCADTPDGPRCVMLLASGASCGAPGSTAVCAPDTTCEGAAGAQTCVRRGASRGRCRSEMEGTTPCDSPTHCIEGRCVRPIGADAPCDPQELGEACVVGTYCAPSGPGATCQRTGAAGTPCFPYSSMAPRCAGGLVCSHPSGSGVCRRPGEAGGSCDLTFNSVACPPGTACTASSRAAAACLRTRVEAEPNDAPASAQGPIFDPTAFSGRLSDGDPADCYGVTTPAGGAVVVETSTPEAPHCAALDTVVTLYDVSGAVVAANDDDLARRGRCSYLVARGLAAGRHAVCVRRAGAAGPSAAYDLSVGVFGP